MPIQEEIYELIFTKLSQGLDKNRKECLQAWLDESEQNRNAYREICSLWYSGKWAYKREQIQKSEGWEKILEIKKGRRKKRLLKIWSAGVAASVVLIMGAFFVSRFMDKGHVERVTESRQANVTLILASGERVDVGHRTDRMIREAGSVIRSDSALLVYEEHSIDTLSEETVYNELVVPKCGEYKLRLSDGSLIVLNSESKLRYPVNFNGDTREVFLSGEAYFEVETDTTRPFYVVMDRIQVRVYGTSFNVNTHQEKGIETVLVEGKVGIKTFAAGEYVLKPGELACFDRKSGTVEIRDVDARQYTAWTRGIFTFEEETLEQIMATLSLWYDVDVFYQVEAVKELHFSGHLERYKEIRNILDAITEATGVKFSIKERTIIVSQ